MTIKKISKLINAKESKAKSPRLISRFIPLLFIILFVSSMSLIGCTKTPETARKDLSRLNVQYTPEQFLNSAKDGNTKVVELFLQAGMNVNVKNDNGQTALMLAASSGHIKTVKLLIKHGAYIDSKDNTGATALSLATSGNYADVVKLLKKAEIDKSY